jgi:hypothetical protein
MEVVKSTFSESPSSLQLIPVQFFCASWLVTIQGNGTRVWEVV